MTPAELKETLLKQYDQAITQLRQLEGAIQACDELLKTTEEPTTDD
jgi:hypothetical protein